MKAELKKELINLFEELKSKKFPNFPDNSELSDWIEDLILVDAEVAGYASTLLGGSKIDKRYIPTLFQEEKLLNSIKPQSSKELEIFNGCQEYLSLLKKIVQILIQEAS